MNGAFRVVSTPAFEREFRKISRGDVRLIAGLQELNRGAREGSAQSQR
jgi:hypothetical protein